MHFICSRLIRRWLPVLVLATGVALTPMTVQAGINNPTGVFGTAAKITCSPNYGKAVCTLPAVVQIDTSLAIGGAAIGSFVFAAAGDASATNFQTSAGGSINFGSSRSRINSPSDGNIRLSNLANTDFTCLQLGGIASSFGAVCRNGAGVSIKGADNVANAPLTASTITLTGNNGVSCTGTAPVATGTGTPVVDTGSTNCSGTVVAGLTATSIVITFATFSPAISNPPVCSVNSYTQLVSFSYTISTTAITITQTATSSNIIGWNCRLRG